MVRMLMDLGLISMNVSAQNVMVQEPTIKLSAILLTFGMLQKNIQSVLKLSAMKMSALILNKSRKLSTISNTARGGSQNTASPNERRSKNERRSCLVVFVCSCLMLFVLPSNNVLIQRNDVIIVFDLRFNCVTLQSWNNPHTTDIERK